MKYTWPLLVIVLILALIIAHMPAWASDMLAIFASNI